MGYFFYDDILLTGWWVVLSPKSTQDHENFKGGPYQLSSYRDTSVHTDTDLITFI